jgi:hypothetical protein
MWCHEISKKIHKLMILTWHLREWNVSHGWLYCKFIECVCYFKKIIRTGNECL